MRLIDADALVHELTELVRINTGEYKNGIVLARLVAMEAPTVDLLITQNEESGHCTYYEENGKKPSCTHSCHGCVWYSMQYDENPCLYCEVLLAEKEKLICPYCEKRKEYESAHDD